MNIKELDQYIFALNNKNDYDLDWEWYGQEEEPVVRVFEQAEDHLLALGPLNDIKRHIQSALANWGLEDV